MLVALHARQLAPAHLPGQTTQLCCWKVRAQPARHGINSHTAPCFSCLAGDLLLVNGGSSADGTDLNDSWLLHLPSSTWTPAPSIASPAPRHGHAMWSAASLEGAVLYGGQAGTLPSSPFWGDTWAWCASKAGSLRGGMGALGSWVKVQNASYAPHGGAPQPRAYVAAAGAAGRNLLFGGFSGYQGGLNDELHQDTWALNASSILKRACL